MHKKSLTIVPSDPAALKEYINKQLESWFTNNNGSIGDQLLLGTDPNYPNVTIITIMRNADRKTIILEVNDYCAAYRKGDLISISIGKEPVKKEETTPPSALIDWLTNGTV